MKLFRVVSSLILVLGLLLAVFGGIILRSVETNIRLMEAMQNEGLARGIDTREFRAIAIRNAVGYVVAGLVAAISGLGLLLRRNWARRLWMGLATVLLAFLTFQTVRAIWFSGVDWGALLAQMMIIGTVGLLMWHIGRTRTAEYLMNASVTE